MSQNFQMETPSFLQVNNLITEIVLAHISFISNNFKTATLNLVSFKENTVSQA